MAMAALAVVFILLLLSSSCKSDDQLTQAKPLTPGDMLVSKDGVFALGFFSPDNSNKSLYIGIWYHGIPERTVVWVANRDTPVTDPSSSSVKLAITNSQMMVLSDSRGRALWTTKTTTNTTTTVGGIRAGAEVVAVLLHTGNFVLQLSNDDDTTNMIWQSFDEPTDTILPSMKFVLSYKAQVAERLVAWKSPEDPSTGDISFSVDPGSNLQAFIWNGTLPYFRYAFFDPASTSGYTYQNNGTSVTYESLFLTGDELYYMLTVTDASPHTRITLGYSGLVRLLAWNRNTSAWVVLSENPNGCEMYGSCGPFGYCHYMGFGAASIPTCQCFDGFEPLGDLNFSRGCRRKEELKCGKENYFVTLPNMKVPDKFLQITNRSLEQRAAACSDNCSCTAYAYGNFSNTDTMGDCLLWDGGLVDTEIGIFTDNIYLRLGGPPLLKIRAVL